MSETPEIGGTEADPVVNVEAGKSYWWCACGRSKTQPFCDGSHKGTAFSPREFKAETTGEVWFCTCKRSDKPRRLCDGSHKKLRRNARSPARILLRGNPRAHAGAGGGGFEEARHRPAGRGGPDL